MHFQTSLRLILSIGNFWQLLRCGWKKIMKVYIPLLQIFCIKPEQSVEVTRLFSFLENSFLLLVIAVC